LPVIIEFSRCIGTYPSAKFELLTHKKLGFLKSRTSKLSLYIMISPTKVS